MAKSKDDLFLYEALALRDEYDSRISVLKHILTGSESSRDIYSRGMDTTRKEFDDGFNAKQAEEDLKSLETRRVKLNQAIQAANFTAKFTFGGEAISIAEALENRKKLLKDIDGLKERVKKSAFKEIVHKEERDIEYKPNHTYSDAQKEFQQRLTDLRRLKGLLYDANHASMVKFKDEA